MSAIRRLRAAIDAHPEQTITVRVGAQWEPRTYAGLSADVSEAAALLRSSGIGAGHRVGILGENSYEWVVYDLACMAVGAVSVGMLEDELLSRSIDDLVGLFGLAALAIDPRHVPDDAAAPLLGKQPASLRLLTFPDPPHDRPASPHEEPGDVFTLVFSSGTSGRVKCLRIGGAGVLEAVDRFAEAFSFGIDDSMLVGLPLSSFQQRLMMYCAFDRGAGVVLTVPKRMFAAMAAGLPTAVVAPPQFFHGIEQRFVARPEGDQEQALARAREADLVPEGPERRSILRSVFADAYAAVGDRTRILITGAAPTRRSTLELLEQMGLPLFEAYASNEAGTIAWNRPGSKRIGSTGLPAHGPGAVTTVDGTIVARPPRPFCWGYEPGFGDTDAVFGRDGSVRTGDRGRIDEDGFVYIDGRADDVLVTTGGLKLDPVVIELEIDRVAGAGHPVLFTHQGGGTQLLMFVDAEDRARVEDQVDDAVSTLNGQLPTGARIQRVVWQDLVLTEEDGFLTRNRKINRSAVREHFVGALGLAHR